MTLTANSADLNCTHRLYACECGHQWLKGQSGYHDCLEHRRMRQTELNVGMDELIIKPITPPTDEPIPETREYWTQRASRDQDRIIGLETEVIQLKDRWRVTRQLADRLLKKLKAIENPGKLPQL